ncbi:hypothetical protein FOMPIDRAFT_1118731 [Fomitopsis schrenkii]|uniref:Uncharacterized protein n=1 Tax=Fomitopsis schrenkii TaxID=2126942 RepID=S8FM26_FOMSC|nr:hypothetical protein FOMPIDRAFT_1118731 [Fomitopsis schrenkii]
MTNLQVRKNQCTFIRRSNDRPNVYLEVRRIKQNLAEFDDLNFLIPPRSERAPGDPLPKFLVFFDDIGESVRAAEHLRARLHPTEREKIVWFNAQMSDEFREEHLTDMMDGTLYGLFCTDSFGMVCSFSSRETAC